MENCTNDTVKYFHCSEEHQARNNKCIEYKYHEEIVAIQIKEKMSRSQAQAMLDMRQPQFKSMNFARAARQSKQKVLQGGMWGWGTVRQSNAREKQRKDKAS